MCVCGTTEIYGDFIFTLLSNHNTVFLSDFTTLYLYQECMNIGSLNMKTRLA